LKLFLLTLDCKAVTIKEFMSQYTGENIMKLRKLALALGLVFSSGLLITGCSDGGGLNAVVVPPPTFADLAATVQALILDAKTGAPITGKVTLTVFGTDVQSGKIVDTDGKVYIEGQTVSVNAGHAALYVKSGVTVSATSKLSFRLVANVSGYVTNSKDLLIDKVADDGSIQVSVSLVSEAAPPESVMVVQKSVAVIDGKTAEPVAAVTPASTAQVTVVDSAGNLTTQTVTLGSTKVDVPAGATMKDEKGVNLPAGSAAVNVSYNNNATQSALSAFPGGFTLAEKPDGTKLTSSELATTGPASFVSGGLASIEVVVKDASGNDVKAKTFDKLISVSIPVTAGTVNPDNGQLVVDGDIIPIWSYDTTTGQWTAMKLNNSALASGADPAPAANGVIRGKVVKAADGSLSVSFMTDHLSYFNLDWWFWGNYTSAGLGNTKQTCNPTIKIQGAQGNQINLTASLTTNGWTHDWQLDKNTTAPAFETDTIFSAPAQKMVISASLNEVKSGVTDTRVSTANNNGTNQGAVVVENMCDDSKWPILVDVSQLVAQKQVPKTSYANVTVTTRNVCTNDATKSTLMSGDSISAGLNNKFTYATTGTDGKATLANLIMGSTYSIAVTDRSGQYKTITHKVASTGNDLAFDFPVSCQVTTGQVATGLGN
jgi:hypothetical protein